MKNLLVAALIIAPLTTYADGMGLYVPFAFANTETRTVDNNGITATYDVKYDAGTGLGISYDSNLGEGHLYNYRLAIEYIDQDRSIDNTITKTEFNMIHTFGFGVYNNEQVRVFVGPQLHLKTAGHTDPYQTGNNDVQVGIGLAGVVGVNYSFNKYFALAADLNYKRVGTFGGDTVTYTTTSQGLSARFYAYVKFGETYQRKSATLDNNSPTDNNTADENAFE